MNPKLTVTVDAKNRAITTASGMVTVGAKVDVVVVGLPDGIPEWGEGDAFTGTSLRLRLVDECGHDLVRYPLVEGDAWHSESETLSTATPVEFDTDALRRAFCGVAFSEARDFGLILDSAVDDAQYAVGRIKIRQWAAASTEDPTVLPDWRETLAELRTNLAAVKDERIAAERAHTEAETAAGNAADSERTAATSANSAQTAQNAARTSELAAATSATAAETAQNAARASELAAAKAADAAKAAQEGAEKAEAETRTGLATHLNDRENPHGVTKEQIGLGNVDDTSDAAKPISDATRAALDGLDAKLGAKADATDLSRIEAALQDKPDRVELETKADLVEGKVPAAQLPSYVDDVIEFDALADFPKAGERGKIYVALDTNFTYRWSGSAYVEVSPSPDLTPYAKKTEVTKAVKAEESRAVSVENLKADKTTVATLSTTVDDLKSSKRGAYDLAVYRRALYANLTCTLRDGSTGDVISSDNLYATCYFDSSSHGSESYRGQLGADLFLTVTLVTSGGEVTAPGGAVIEIDGESVTIGNLTLTDDNRNFHGSAFRVASEGDYEYELDGQILNQSEMGISSDETLLTSSDGTALKADAVSTAVALAQEKAKADRPFDVADVAAGATLAHSTVSRFSPADASEVAFTLADPPSGKMAEYELWVGCTAAAPASLTFRLANAQIDPRVEGEVEAMQAGKAYAYRVRAFGNPDAAHVTVLISQAEAAPAGYTPDQLYAPDSAFEIDTTKGDGLAFSVQVMATSASGDGGYATVHWGDGTKTRKLASSSSLTDFTHTYAKAGNYVVRISNADRFYLAGAPMAVRALRWGDTVTTASGTYSACLNLGGTVPPWGKKMSKFGGTSSRIDPVTPSASENHGAYTYCSGLTGPIPPWPDRLPNATGSSIGIASLACVYAGCSGLTGQIPAWPRWCGGVSMTYAGCSGLTGQIPAWPLYPTTVGDVCIVLVSTYGTYWHCSGLTGEIPPWPNTGSADVKVSYPISSMAGYDYLGMFAGCSGLTGKIPKWTGSTAESSRKFLWVAGLYAGCTGLEGIWDEDAADADVMPSTATKHTDCVKGASEAVRKHFTAEWGGTKGASST